MRSVINSEEIIMPTTAMPVYGGLRRVESIGSERSMDSFATYSTWEDVPTTTTYNGEIVISGISGRFPTCSNVEELSNTLFRGMVDESEYLGRRFENMRLFNNNINNFVFDHKFFGINEREVSLMDPKLKLLTQIAYESIFDAGFNPIELKGTKTGVFIGSTGIEIPTFGGELVEESMYTSLPTGYSQVPMTTGLMTPTQIVNRISSFFDFKGPSQWVDTTYTNGLIQLDHAINAIKTGICEHAIVAGINVVMDEKKLYEKYGSSLPESVRISCINGETVSVVFLTKRDFSRRFYAKVLHSKMYMEPKQYESGFNYKSEDYIVNVLRKVYNESKVNPSEVTYVETSGVKLVNEDLIREFEPIKKFFGTSTRTTPLYIGSTVPCVCHADPVTGINSLVKMIVAIQKGMIPTRDVKVFVDGQLKGIDYNTKLTGGLMALNSIGLNGLVHVVLEPHYDWMMNKYEPTSIWNKDLTTICRQPRLFTFSGRSEEELTSVFEHVQRCPTDLATHALLKSHSFTTPYTHPYRGFTILNGSRPVREISKCITEKRPIWYVFSGMGTNWSGMGKELMQIERFRNSIYKSATLLKPYNIDLVHLILKEENERFLHQSVMIPSIQIALVDCLKTLGVEPEGIVGHSFGEVVAAYADGCLTHDEAILTSYYRGKFIEEANLPTGGMAIVQLPWEELQRIYPCSQIIVPAYFNSTESVVVSGPMKTIVQLVEDLKIRGIYAKVIESSGIALHSYLLTPIIPRFKETMEKIIRSRKLRSSRWISTTIPEYKWESDEYKYITPEYFLNNLTNPVYFYQAIKRIPKNAITIEIGPRSVLKKVLFKSLGEKMTLVDFMRRESPSHIEYFWNGFGKLYNEGVNFDLMKLIVPVGESGEKTIYPVPIGTKFLSPLVSGYYTRPSVVPEYVRMKPSTYPTSTYYDMEYPSLSESFEYPYYPYPYQYNYPYGEEYKYNNRYPIVESGVRVPSSACYMPTLPTLPLPTMTSSSTFPKRRVLRSTTATTTTVLPTELPTVTPIETSSKYSKTMMYEIDLTNGSEFEYIRGHKINGTTMYPVSGYLYLVWKSLAKIRNVDIELLPISFENVEVHRSTIVTKPIKFFVSIDEVTGRFVIVEGKSIVLSGRVYVPEEPRSILETTPELNVQGWLKSRTDLLELEQIYNELKLRGYGYSDLFQGISRANIEGTRGELMWGGKWIPFLESMFQMHTLGKQGLQLPTQIKSLRIDPRIHLKNLIRYDLNSNVYVPSTTTFVKPTTFESRFGGVLPVIYDPFTRKCVSGGIEINGLYSTSIPKTNFSEPVVLERVNFVPYFEKRGINEEYYVPEVEYRPEYEYVDTYLNECKHHLTKILRKLEYPTYTGIYPTVPTTSFVNSLKSEVFDEKCSNSKYTNGKFLRLLKELSKIECEQELRRVFADKFQLYDAWHKDTIFNTINRDRYLKSCLDTVYENIPFNWSSTTTTTKVPKLKILEIAPVMNVLAPKISSFLSTYPKVDVDYHYVPVGEISDEVICELNSRSSFPIKRVDWNLLAEEFPQQFSTLKDFDLILFNGSFNTILPYFESKVMAKEWLNTISEKCLKRNGFFLFNEFVNQFETINNLKRLEHHIFRPSEEFLTHKYLSECEWRRLFEEEFGLHPVSLKSDSILSTLFLYRKPRVYPTVYPTEYETMRYKDHEIYLNDIESFNWVSKVRQALNEPKYERIWLISENVPTSGVIGLVNALRREPRGERIRCVFVADTIGQPWTTYFDVIKKGDLVMNVYKNGKWGSYRSLRDAFEYPTTSFPFPEYNMDLFNRGVSPVSSWNNTWTNPISTSKLNPNEVVVKVNYAGLNYKDLLLATSKVLSTERKFSDIYENIFGTEFSGFVEDKRYMGITKKRGLSTTTVADLRHCWEVPSEWSLEEAATVPLSYSSAYYTLVVRGGLKRGETVLIHSGATPFGQACISVALQHGCKVFVTVGSLEKREFLLSMFPGRLTEECFGSTKDLVFEQDIMRFTQGRGVDVVLNTLLGEKLEASLRCLSTYGRLLDITTHEILVPTFGEYPADKIYVNNKIVKINFDLLFEPESYEWKRVYKLVEEGIRSGVVRPLRTKVFDRVYVKDAFTHMIKRKPIHKVLIKVWEPKESRFDEIVSTVSPKSWFSPYHTYIITGGLTPVGLELAKFLVERGVRKLLLTSRVSGGVSIENVYLSKKLQYLQEKYGVIIGVAKYDVRVESECLALLDEAIELSEEKKLGGVFQLDTIFDDKRILGIPTLENFKCALDDKYLGTYHLDKFTRNMDGFFVVFSSVQEGKPYNYATSAVERLCELRRQDGKHAVVMQWGPFEQNFEQEEFFLSDVKPTSRISSYLNNLERILLNKNESSTIWSCKPVPTTMPVSSSYMYNRSPLMVEVNNKFSGYPTIVEYIESIIEPINTRSCEFNKNIFLRTDVDLITLGLERQHLFEIKNFLEKYYNCYMPLSSIETLTLEKIKKIEQQYSILKEYKDLKEIREVKEWKQQVNYLPTKYNYLMPRRSLEKLNTVELTTSQPVIVIHPIEGHVNMLKSWAKHMKYPVYGMQFTSEALGCESIESLAQYYWQELEKEFKTVTKFHLAGYSFGASVAFEMASKRSDRIASLTFLDGSYSYINSNLNPFKSTFGSNLSEIEAECLYSFISQYTQIPCRQQFIQRISSINSAEERIKAATKELFTRSQFTFDPVDLELAAKSYIKKMIMSFSYKPKSILRVPEVLLFRPTQRNEYVELFGEEYGLNKVINGKLQTYQIEGDQRSFLESTNAIKVASILNDYLMQYF